MSAGESLTTAAELVVRLRARAETVDSASTADLLAAAADEIERLCEKITHMQKAIRNLIDGYVQSQERCT